MEPNTLMPVAEDTICAVATAPGRGGIAVIRVSGPQAIAVADKLWRGKPLARAKSHTVHLGTLVAPSGEQLDQAVATVFLAPRSYTGEHTVELSVHGSTYIQRSVVNALIEAGCRLAEPGEFTRRAFASGRLDLAQAEAVADLIAADSRAAHRQALKQMRGSFSDELQQLHDRLLHLASLLELELDFSEEDVEFAPRDTLVSLARELRYKVDTLASTFAFGNAMKEGVPVAIVGEPNAGKSTLLNRLVGEDRAIVSDIRGTTRDTIEAITQIQGIAFRFIDTAGLHRTTDAIESIGIERARSSVAKARIVVWLIDPTSPVEAVSSTFASIADRLDPDSRLLALIGKADLKLSATQHLAAAEAQLATLPRDIPAGILRYSDRLDADIDQLRRRLGELAIDHAADSDTVVTNVRHHEALRNASISISRAISGLETNLPSDLVAQDIRETLHHLGTITGTITTPDILNNIFTHFCIGK